MKIDEFDFGPKFNFLVITSNSKKDFVKGFNDGQDALDYFAEQKKTGNLVYFTEVKKAAIDKKLIP